MNFADKLHSAIKKSGSVLCAGLDPDIEALPKFILAKAGTQASDEETLYKALFGFYEIVLTSLREKVAIVKPNIAFFEQYGIGGMRAFASVCSKAHELEMLVLADVKRGDIGPTAKAYSRAYLGEASFGGKRERMFHIDAITVNPFLGFDTIEPYFEEMTKYGKGVFVLVRTSNPGAGDLQDDSSTESKQTVSEKVASWVDKAGEKFRGASGYSSLGAVVGATYPGEAKKLRALMPHSYFLIPGFGAQGGAAHDAVSGFDAQKGGGIVNASRGLINAFPSRDISEAEFKIYLEKKAAELNAALNGALG